MKNLVIFFLLFVFNLISVNGFAYASTHNEKICFSIAKSFGKTQKVKNACAESNRVTADTNGLNDEDFNLISLDDEDDNEDVVKKHIVQTYFLIAFCYKITSNRFSLSADPLPSVDHLSYISSFKYILQRTLRI